MGTSALTLVLAIVVNGPAQAPAASGAIKQDEIDYQNQTFQQWWDTELLWKYDDLPVKGNVPKFRIPYSGHDYTDRSGGTMDVMRKYDVAFNGRVPMATEWEREDVGKRRPLFLFRGRNRLPEDFRLPETERRRGNGRGLLANLFSGNGGGGRVPAWYGHCNGRTAASIRHAEPQRSVMRNGVVFTPADIKGLLAEVYMYQDTEFLGGIDFAVNPGTFHVVLSNWLGRGSHPVGMDSTLGEVVFNYPIYAYATSHLERSDNRVEVKMNAAYAKSSGGEHNQSPRIKGVMYFHYTLNLNEEGEITGGEYYGDSSRVDMLWSPLQPVQGGKKGNEIGNPYIDVKEILSIWRESVSKDLRDKWFNIDPTDEDRIEEPEEEQVVQAEEEEDAEESEAEESAESPEVETEESMAEGSGTEETESAEPAVAPEVEAEETEVMESDAEETPAEDPETEDSDAPEAEAEESETDEPDAEESESEEPEAEESDVND
ncbi:MAG: hypothetical protein H8E44_13035 [Planctomycetes bacterium]|nr:hypothetical protein [Planctomycetota bacterium]MBL7038465.1 hypothetical protein [Pirellulaceae bacterium]